MRRERLSITLLDTMGHAFDPTVTSARWAGVAPTPERNVLSSVCETAFRSSPRGCSMKFSSFVPESAPSFIPSHLRESAYRGDLVHKLDLHLLFCDCSHPVFLELITARSQSNYIRQHRPDLLPPDNPNGTPPNDHTVSSHFEHHYNVDKFFASRYLKWVRESNKEL